MAARAVAVRSPDAEDQSRPRSLWTRVLAIGLFALAMAELATAIAAALGPKPRT
jgi:hypothetical protein